MMLITLVENAIRHGLVPSDDGGRVLIQARAESGQLVVDVEDDGVGFGAAPTGGTGVGLANIRSRLATQYGAAARLSIGGAVPKGVRASIRLPMAADAASSDRRDTAIAPSAPIAVAGDTDLGEECHAIG